MKFTFNIDISWEIWYIFHRWFIGFVKGLLHSTSKICKKRKETQVMRKLKRMLALGAAALMSVSALTVPASASNYKDTYWSFSVDANKRPHRTELREKTDASGVYVYYKSGTMDGVACDVLNSENDSMCKKYGIVYKGQKRRVAQYVYENGFRWCKLELTSDKIYSGAGGSGVWSPDSVGSYPYCNL